MKRFLHATFAIPASPGGVATATVTQADLDNSVPQGGGVTPLALVWDPEDAAVTCKSLVSGNPKNDENKANILPASANGLSLAALNKSMNFNQGGIQCPHYPTSHGLEFVGDFGNTGGAVNIEIVISVENMIRVGGRPAEFPGALRGAPESAQKHYDSFGPRKDARDNKQGA